MARVDIHDYATQMSQAADERRKLDQKRTVWVFFWTLVAFKIATVAIIFWAAEGATEARALVTATTWPFLIIPGCAVAGPVTYYVRLRRVRARRERLRRAEWMLD